ncbi:transporter substrate-binding domain-containing protein [Mitsuaria sp. WAJ17]|uniref:substrate-binding periplasmic protein n=1 Tax=Mitsuaria sp. WAJ17 TaxID=2761452 RepID=UPI0016008C8E|nr:transporter substrate-binding domain-containing protein [Mitsuaria sp. WAJ17]MBB2485292.1 transporter substrate-binding domain-containing protein [Mitsuaria sp. WAJ17]
MNQTQEAPLPDPQRRRLLGVCAGMGLDGAPAVSDAAALHIPLAVGEHVNRAFVVPLLQVLEQGGGWTWDLQFAPMGRVLALAERGQSLAFGLGRTAAREAVMGFSDPLFSSRIWPVMRRDRGLRLSSVEDLRGLTVCLARSMSYGAALDAAKGRDFQVEYADGDPMIRLRMLAAQRCDVALMSHRSADPWLLERRLRTAAGYTSLIEVGAVPLITEPVHVAGALGSPLLRYLPQINAALRRQHLAIQALVDSEL